MFPIPPWPPEGGSCSPRCLPTRATVVSIKARKSNLHWSTRLRTTLAGPGVHLQGRSLGSRPPNHESTHDPEEDIGLRSETIVAHDLAAGPTRHSPARKTNGTEHSHLGSQTRHLKRYLYTECGTSPEPDLKVDAA